MITIRESYFEKLLLFKCSHKVYNNMGYTEYNLNEGEHFFANGNALLSLW